MLYFIENEGEVPMNYKETMEYIHNTEKFGVNLGLSRIEKLLQLLKNPHKKIKTIHIAGTNGKGSTTAMLTNILVTSGYKVGMYTSPFLEEFEERIQINNCNIPKERLCEVVATVKDASMVMIEEGFEQPTEFEIITAVMFKYFYEEKIDLAVIEVGLGGRFDATNVIEPILSIIASISLDHMHVLGDTIEKIAFEKAGIIKENTPLVLYPQKASVLEVIKKVAEEKNVPITIVQENAAKFRKVNKTADMLTQEIEINTEKGRYISELKLLGTHQLLNTAVVVVACEKLIEQGYKISEKNINTGLSTVLWKGRMEIMSNNPLTVIDGAHNIDAIIRLRESVGKYFPNKNIILILGILSDKQVDNMVEVIAKDAKKVITVTPNSERAELAEDLLEIVKKVNDKCEYEKSYEEALRKAREYAESEDIILISGSLYMIGDMRKLLR